MSYKDRNERYDQYGLLRYMIQRGAASAPDKDKGLELLDEIYADIIKPNTNSACMCANHNIRFDAHFMPKSSFMSDGGVARSIPVKLNYCPECGRKF